MAKKKKLITSVAAVATAAAMLLSGTFAWQSINQTALNEASDVINPGGRLHDDFDGSNKDVYVENFADEDIFARIQLSEYFAIIANYGKEGAQTKTDIAGTATLTDGKIVDPEYAIHYFDEDADNATADYWNWTTGGSTVFMPTFNLNKDSLVADINGTYVDAIGGISNRDGNQYTDYTKYEVDATETGIEIYDGDTDMDDEVESDFENLATYEQAGDIVTVSQDEEGNAITHTAKETLGATLISMDEWKNTYNSQPGEYWVYDTDGWVYWAQAIKPGTATGLLLDGIALNGVMDDTWYYAINVVAQFVTADDVGKSDNTGFYDTENGTAPSTDAEALLTAIGVDMTGTSSEPSVPGGDVEIQDGTIDLSTTTEANVYPATSYTLSNGTDETYTYSLTSGSEYAVLEGNVLTINGDAADGSAIVVEGTNGTDTATLNLTVSHDIIWKLSDGTVVEDWDEILVDSTISAYWGDTKLPISLAQSASADDEDKYVYNADKTELTFNWGDEMYWLSTAYVSDVLEVSEELDVDVRWNHDVTASISINGGDYVAITDSDYFHLNTGDTVALKATTSEDGVEVTNLAETEWFIGVNGNSAIDDELGTGTTYGSAYGAEFTPVMTSWPQEDQYCFYVQLWGYNYLYFTIQFGEPEIQLEDTMMTGESDYLTVNDEAEYVFTITAGSEYATITENEHGVPMLTVNENAKVGEMITVQAVCGETVITKTVTITQGPTLTLSGTVNGVADNYLYGDETVTITVEGYDDMSLFTWEIVEGSVYAVEGQPGVFTHYAEGTDEWNYCSCETVIKATLTSDNTVYGVFEIICD